MFALMHIDKWHCRHMLTCVSGQHQILLCVYLRQNKITSFVGEQKKRKTNNEKLYSVCNKFYLCDSHTQRCEITKDKAMITHPSVSTANTKKLLQTERHIIF